MTTRTNGRTRRAGTGPSVPDDDESMRQDIALRAYYRYCDRGRISGFEIEDWLVAERDVRAERATAPADRPGRPTSGGRAGRRPKQSPVR